MLCCMSKASKRFTYLLPTKLNNIMYFLAKSQPLKKSDYKDIMATVNPTTRILISIVYSPPTETSEFVLSLDVKHLTM